MTQFIGQFHDEIGAVDNAALRAITDLDTLAASRVLTKLTHQRGLLKQGGAGASTYYQLVALPKRPLFIESKASDLGTDRTDLGSDHTDLGFDRIERYAEINKKIANLSARPRKEVLWPIIVELCLIEPQTIQGLAKRLNRDITSIKQSYINPLRKKGWLDYLYPDVVNHPEQAYTATKAGEAWLTQQGVAL